jgi:predicted DNA-binding transcriptional regulator AlpA
MNLNKVGGNAMREERLIQEDSLMSKQELARRLHTTVGTLNQWIKYRLAPPCIRLGKGKKIVFKREDVEAFIDSRRCES